MGKRIPGDEIHRGANKEKRDVQIEVLVLQQLALRNQLRVGPAIQASHPDGDRQKQGGQDRQDAARRADRPPQHHAPGAAGQLVHHAQREAAERHAQAEHVSHQIRLEKLPAVDQETNKGHGKAGGTRKQEPALQTCQRGDRDVGGFRQLH